MRVVRRRRGRYPGRRVLSGLLPGTGRAGGRRWYTSGCGAAGSHPSGVHTDRHSWTDEGYVVGMCAPRGADRGCRARWSGAGELVGRLRWSRRRCATWASIGSTDLRAPERVFQLGVKSSRASQPVQDESACAATAFLGRAQELAEVVGSDLQGRRATGDVDWSGRTGKTRLALQAAAEVAERFPDGLWWGGFGAVARPRARASTVAHVVGRRLRCRVGPCA
jgi:hypothetical protein